ncbi:MAG: hypothetical protein JWL64_1071 [Frankiales bacterium]|nr:hypothetical protein [Frankiales bacterium]
MPDTPAAPPAPGSWYSRRDPFALVGGVLALLGSGLFLLDDLSAVDLPLRLLWPAAVLALGIAIGVGSWTRWRRGEPAA